jgi:hypothetical protein
MNYSSMTIPQKEMHDLTLGTPGRFVYRLYTELPPGPYKRGYKSPGEIRSARSLRLLSKLFPKTLLIVGIRHPVLWFESLYNFKVQNLRPELPSNYFGDPNQLIGKCPTFLDFNCVGTAKGLFHVHLAQLGKTTQTKELEQRYPILKGNITQSRNPIFLFDVEQLSPRDNNSTTYYSTQLIDTLRQDLQTALGLTLPLPPPPKKRPGKILKQKKIQKSRDRHKIQICKAKFEPVRMELMRIAREASDWIRNSGFLDHPDVTVSSRHYFENVILKGHWEKDPCDNFEPRHP